RVLARDVPCGGARDGAACRVLNQVVALGGDRPAAVRELGDGAQIEIGAKDRVHKGHSVSVVDAAAVATAVAVAIGNVGGDGNVIAYYKTDVVYAPAIGHSL